MAGKKMGLGKGLDVLIPSAEKIEKKGEKLVNINEVEPNKNQPRTLFNEDSLQELTESVKQYGILQPLLVQKKDNYYEIIAGERRWRAAKLAGLKEIPILIRDYTDQERMEIALIENIQREDLNPIEEAMAFKRLLDEYQMKQEELAIKVSKSRTTVTNAMRLLNLQPDVQQLLVEGKISAGHARTLLGIDNKDEQLKIANRIISEELSVRETEKIVAQLKKPNNQKPKKETDSTKQAIYEDMENKLRTNIGTKVKIKERCAGKGKLEIEYYTEEDLERICNILMSVKGE